MAPPPRKIATQPKPTAATPNGRCQADNRSASSNPLLSSVPSPKDEAAEYTLLNTKNSTPDTPLKNTENNENQNPDARS